MTTEALKHYKGERKKEKERERERERMRRGETEGRGTEIKSGVAVIRRMMKKEQNSLDML
jgi:hypothetical protein